MPKRGTSATELSRSDEAAQQASTAVSEPGALSTERPTESCAKRKLSTILFADVKEFSRLMEADDEATLRTFKSHLTEINALICCHDGRAFGAAGDSVLAEFSSPVEAVRCAAAIQAEVARRNAGIPQDRRLEFRIGINLGDVLVEGTLLFGDGVIIAARLQQLADPGGIVVSGSVYDQIKTKSIWEYEFLGAQQVKNIAEPVRTYRLHSNSPAPNGHWTAWRRWRWDRVAAGIFLSLAAIFAVWQSALLVFPSFERVAGFSRALPVTDRASIAVLPFGNLGARQNEYFSDGLTEDLISALGRFSSVSVMSWNAVAGYKGQAPSPDQLARDLSVRYVVDGSVRRSSDRLRVTVRLSDAERGTLLWSERYEEALSDVFAMQDKITRSIVSTLATRVGYLEQQRAHTKPTEKLDAYDLYLRGRQAYRRFTRPANLEAQGMFKKAIAFDPDYADAHAALASTYIKSAEMGWTERPDKALEWAHELTQSALRLDPSNELAHVLLAILYTYQRQYELALAELDRATQYNPNYTGHYAERGWVLLLSGLWDEAIDALEEALRYDPNPTPNTFSNLALAYYFRERYDEAVVILKRALDQHPGHVPIHIALAALYAKLGRTEDAERAAADVRRLHPFFDAQLYGDAFRDPVDRERIRGALRRAGL